MLDRRLVAVGAAAAVVCATFNWLRSRRSQLPQHHHRQRHTPRLLPRGRPLPSSPELLSIVSYNILCELYANGRRFPHVFAQYLDPDYRWARLQSELEAFDADLIALQEVTVDRWMELKTFMSSLGYTAVVQSKAAANSSDFMLALFYRAAKFRLCWSEERSRALLAALQVTAPGEAEGQLVWVANVHLEGSPYRPNDRVSQLRSALHRLETHMGGREAAEVADVVICGDFNSLPDDSPCWLLRRGRLERGHTDACCPQVPTTKETIAHPFALHEAYESSTYQPPFTRKTGPQGALLDFIWCSRHMPVVAVMRPLQKEFRDLVNRFYLPNRHHPSDHLPVGAVLRLTPAAEHRTAAAADSSAAAAGFSKAMAAGTGAADSSAGKLPDGKGAAMNGSATTNGHVDTAK